MRLTTDSTQKHIILLKLVDAYENVPDFGNGPVQAMTPQREWLSKLGAIFNALGATHTVTHRTNMSILSQHRDFALNNIVSQIGDVIEELRLDLELDGKSEIGSVYQPGDVYSFFSDLKAIIANAQQTITIVDPYFTGEAFDAYLSTCSQGVSINILSERYTDDLKSYAEKHAAQFGTSIELRKSKEIHDRLVIIDQSECWIIGNSIKDAAKKSTYLIPLSPTIAASKIEIYSQIQARANEY
ncbi:MAG: hypothetical protein R3E73_04695 [Porticoccaceae bacterium]|nr:hypothetical protein [Pseudomonadales bacterium]MCP5172064.1 hypothetical protein [Pseudomonadales bacterium]